MSKTQNKTFGRIEIIYKTLDEITPYENNPRKNAKAVKTVARSIKEFGFRVPIVIDKDSVIVCGHTRYKAARKLGLESVPTVSADDLTDEQIAKFRIIDNKTAELSEWDFPLLKQELAFSKLDADDWGLDFFKNSDFDENVSNKYKDAAAGALKQKFIMPPFSILDARQGDWQKRKKTWIEVIGNSGDGRDDALLGQGLYDIAKNSGSKTLTATSIFDPVLCEVMYHWFSKRGDKVIDPFAGGHVRGVVAQMLEREYHGNDLRPEQIDVNQEASGALKGALTVYGGGTLNRNGRAATASILIHS